MKRTLIRLAALMLLAFGGFALASPINDSHALQGVKQGKGVFLIDFADPKKTAFYLDIISGTHAGLKRQGVKPDFVIVYIGPTVRFLTTRAGWRTRTGTRRQPQGHRQPRQGTERSRRQA